MASKVPEVKRKGHKMSQALVRSLVFSETSNHSICSLIRQQQFLQQVINELGKTPETVVRTLTELRDAMTRPQSLTLHMAAQLDSLPDDPVAPWLTHLFADWDIPSDPAPDGLAEIVADHQLLKESSTESPMGAALALGSVESSFLILAVRTIEDIHHPDLAALLVALQYFDQVEGPFWRNLRGQGLIYDSMMNLKVVGLCLYPTIMLWLMVHVSFT